MGKFLQALLVYLAKASPKAARTVQDFAESAARAAKAGVNTTTTKTSVALVKGSNSTSVIPRAIQAMGINSERFASEMRAFGTVASRSGISKRLLGRLGIKKLLVTGLNVGNAAAFGYFVYDTFFKDPKTMKDRLADQEFATADKAHFIASMVGEECLHQLEGCSGNGAPYVINKESVLGVAKLADVTFSEVRHEDLYDDGFLVGTTETFSTQFQSEIDSLVETVQETLKSRLTLPSNQVANNGEDNHDYIYLSKDGLVVSDFDTCIKSILIGAVVDFANNLRKFSKSESEPSIFHASTTQDDASRSPISQDNVYDVDRVLAITNNVLNNSSDMSSANPMVYDSDANLNDVDVGGWELLSIDQVFDSPSTSKRTFLDIDQDVDFHLPLAKSFPWADHYKGSDSKVNKFVENVLSGHKFNLYMIDITWVALHDYFQYGPDTIPANHVKFFKLAARTTCRQWMNLRGLSSYDECLKLASHHEFFLFTLLKMLDEEYGL